MNLPLVATTFCAPGRRGISRRQFTLGDVDPNGNVGIKLGCRSGGLVDVDLDSAEAVELADIYLLETDAVFGRRAKRRSRRLYISPEAVFEAFTDPIKGDRLLELRADGQTGGCHQTLVPPSVTGRERREWVGGGIEPAFADARVLRQRCVYLAIGCLVMRYVGETAARNR